MSKKILIIEDEKPIAHAMELKLKKAGFDAQIAINGEEAIKLLEEDNFDLALLDLVMPKMDGFGVLEEVKKKKIKIKIMVTSNLSQSDDIKKAKDLGAVDFLIKSDTSIVEIVDKVKSILGQ
jgi:DNA-binding response OmpR family regulator